ncbi:MAG: hypothetical protein OXK77_07560 [Gemmatimonadota bacterium]|nr:hypothetical protein [Gemmatimonadota bacterium]
MEEGRAPDHGQLPSPRRPLLRGLGCSRGRIHAAALPVALATACAAAAGTAAFAPGTGNPGTTSGEALSGAPAEPDIDRPQDRSLMLWGGVSPDGDLHLDPAFVLDAPASLPDETGAYRIEVFGAGRVSLVSLDFEMGQLSEGGGGFVFMVPFRDDWPTLDRIVLTGPEGTARLDRDTRMPMAIVVDRASGRIRAILRGDAAEARIAAAALEEARADTADGGTRVLVSYGLPRPVPQ